jgi:hypothetical protein
MRTETGEGWKSPLFLRKDAGKELEYRGLISNEGSGAAKGNT